MGAQLRIYRRRIRSVKATKKITRAMELISASRIVKAQQRVSASTPYANELTRAVSAVNYFKFRNRAIKNSWTGFSDNPTYAHAKMISDELIASFIADAQVDINGVDELHIVYTEFKSMITQIAMNKRMLPLEVVEADGPAPAGLLPMYEFEPNAGEVLNALLPRYIESRVYNALLQSAASEHAARRRAMKSATDNADELIKSLTRLANAARQAEITQEISEIVGGADALASASAGSE